MPAKKKEINLLPKEAWETGVIGKLLHWTLNIGRYVVVFTELVVISAFLFRFGLDRKLTDLNEEMSQKKSIVISYSDLEGKFRLVQDQLEKVKEIRENSLAVGKILDSISQITPLDARYSSINVMSDKVILEGTTLSDIGLATLLATSQNSDIFEEVSLENVSSAKDKTQSINFRMTLGLVGREKKK